MMKKEIIKIIGSLVKGDVDKVVTIAMLERLYRIGYEEGLKDRAKIEHAKTTTLDNGWNTL